MENEKKRFVEQELNSEDYKRTVYGAKVLKQAGLIGSGLVAMGVLIVKVGPKLAKNIIAMI